MGVYNAERWETQEETSYGIEGEARWPAIKIHSYCYFFLETEAGGVKVHPKSLNEEIEILHAPPSLQTIHS